MFDPLEPWAQGEPANKRAKHNQVIEALNKMGTLFLGGGDSFQTPGGTSFTVPPPDDRPSFFVVQVEGDEGPFGCYYGRAVTYNSQAAIDPGSIDISTLQGTPYGDELFIINRYELADGTGHELTIGDGPSEFLAVMASLQTNENPPRQVAYVWGLPFGTCES